MNLPTEDARGMARALTELLDTGRHALVASGSPLAARVADHVGCPLAEIPNVAEHLPSWDHANLQCGVDAYLARHSPDAAWFGIAGSRHFTPVVDMLTTADTNGQYRLGAVDYTTVATGPATAAEAVQLGLVCTAAPDGSPVVLAVQGAEEARGEDRCHLQVLAAERSTGAAVREEILTLAREHDVFRGQVLAFGASEHRGNRLLTFLPRPSMRADQVVLADGVLASIEHHVVRSAERTAALREHGQHLKRGLLLYGPPGTGKTHTVRYLLSRLPACTVFVLSGVAMIRWLRATAALARRLEPSVVVVEDVDLIAHDRSMTMSGNPALFELLDEMDGIGSEADVTFVLTTNRVDTMEEALAQRPGRVDLAVEIPKPDAACRERLLRLYGGPALRLPDASPLVAATDGVTASFVREWVRRAVLKSVTSGSGLDEPALRAALDELMSQQQALTRSMLGGRR
ncbi:AAA family ATPase [Actinophytocola sp.]|uniref:AAA family ATPase n=1 Tax=Actinophytocola sp. TaxID=1872138 RepID=UPI003D6B12A8